MEPTTRANTARSTVLETPRLRVTTWLPDDLAELHALQSDAHTMRYMGYAPEDQVQVRARLERYVQEQIQPGWTRWRVEDTHGNFLGRAGFQPVEERAQRELGYALTPAAWGQGFGTELARALVRWHFSNPDPHLSSELAAVILIGNAASRRILEKAGFGFVANDLDREVPLAHYSIAAPPHG